jgi:hypothetical protein
MEVRIMPNRNKVFSMISVPILALIVFLTSPFIVFSATINPVLYGTNIPAANSTANNIFPDVIGNKTDAAASGAVTSTESLVAYAKQNVNAQEKAIAATVTTIMSGNNNLFAVTGGPIKIVEIVAYVSTVIEAKSCLINYNIDPTAPATDTVFGTDGTALEINADAADTLYTWDGVVANDLTATTNGVALGTAAYSGLVVPIGSIELAAAVSTSATGAITVYMRYVPLSPDSTVAIAP